MIFNVAVDVGDTFTDVLVFDNLYDVDAKYGDVVPFGEVLEYLRAGGAVQRSVG
jgi:hypothetical protein